MKKIATLLCALTIFFGNNYVVKSESIQEEIERIEAEANEYKDDMKTLGHRSYLLISTKELYTFWDNKLNSLWKRLSKELTPEMKKKVLAQQRTWIKRKIVNDEGSIEEAIESFSNGIERTRARSYILAKYLAEIRNEPFYLSSEILEDIHEADPLLHDVLKKFEGQWKLENNNSIHLRVERSDSCLYGIEGSDWTFWIKDEVILSNFDVYNYTSDKIIFKKLKNGKDIFYRISFDYSDSILFSTFDSLEKLSKAEKEPFEEEKYYIDSYKLNKIY